MKPHILRPACEVVSDPGNSGAVVCLVQKIQEGIMYTYMMMLYMQIEAGPERHRPASINALEQSSQSTSLHVRLKQ